MFPDRDRLKLDLQAISERGFTVVRTYTAPPDDLLDLAADGGLRVLPDAFYLDWRYLIGASRRQLKEIATEASATLRAEARRLAGNPQVFGLSLGNEIPADVVRWVGTRNVADTLQRLASIVKDEDPDRLVTYANYPTTEYLPLDGLDFVTFNVFLERIEDFRRYLTHLHHVAGDRPLVLGELGFHAGPESRDEEDQAQSLASFLSTALEFGVAGTCVFSWTDDWWVGNKQVEGWRFGLTRADRTPRRALDAVESFNRNGLESLREKWPSISVVVCAHNAASTLDECLLHTCALDYPDLEIIVVNDGSTDRTAEIVSAHPRARRIDIEHSGLGAARNTGFRAAQGEIVAYIDADAFPTPEWPFYIALGFNARMVGGVGGPNLPPADDPVRAQVVARAPGGPVQVLFTDDRAEHVPGCNMAFWKRVLEEVGGCDPVYRAAGDDVDLCWKILDRGWDINFSPAALVWHRRRGGLRPYLRQQRGYGRAEALVEARHPDRFGPLHTACWRGRIYNTLSPPSRRQRIYRGPFGLSPFQSVYQSGGHLLDVIHQVGLLIALLALVSAPLALIHPAMGLPAALALAGISVVGAIDMARAKTPPGEGMGFRAAVAVHHLLQPVVRTWGRWTHGSEAVRDLDAPSIPGPVRRVGRSVLLFPATYGRLELISAAVRALRIAGARVGIASEWEDHDARVSASWLVYGELVTSHHVPEVVQLRIRPRPDSLRLAVVGLIGVGLLVASPVLGGPVILFALADIAWGLWRGGPWARGVLERRGPGEAS